MKGLPYPENDKEWHLNETGIFFTKKNGMPLDSWKIVFEDSDNLKLIPEVENPE